MAEQCQSKSANVCNERPTTVSGWQLDGRLPAPSFKVKIPQRFRGSISQKKKGGGHSKTPNADYSKGKAFVCGDVEYFNHDLDKRRILSCLLTLEKARI